MARRIFPFMHRLQFLVYAMSRLQDQRVPDDDPLMQLGLRYLAQLWATADANDLFEYALASCDGSVKSFDHWHRSARRNRRHFRHVLKEDEWLPQLVEYSS